MKFPSVIFFSFSHSKGGAAKAAFRMFGLVDNKDKHFYFSDSLSAGANGQSFYQFGFNFITRCFSYVLVFFFKTNNPSKHSLSLFSSIYLKKKLKLEGLKHFHWINNDALSIFAIGKFIRRNKCIITLHDEWLYAGAEHCINDFFCSDTRYIDGYHFSNSSEKFLNWNVIIWHLKKYYLSDLQKVIFTVPSKWMLERAQKSYLLKNARIELLPNVIPTNVFTPKERYNPAFFAANNNGFFTICFGAIGSFRNPLKGGELLVKALWLLKNSLSIEYANRVKLVIFGANDARMDFPFEVKYAGHISNEAHLASIYQSADVVVVPSLVESFGQVAAESLACGTPVVSFNYSGLVDIIDHRINGYLSEPYEPSSLKDGIEWVMSLSDEELCQVRMNAVAKIENSFSAQIIKNKLKSLYNNIADVC